MHNAFDSHTHVSLKLIKGPSLVYLYSENFITVFYPSRNNLVPAVQMNVNELLFCRPCYKVCVFCAPSGFVLMSEREKKKEKKNHQ